MQQQEAAAPVTDGRLVVVIVAKQLVCMRIEMATCAVVLLPTKLLN